MIGPLCVILCVKQEGLRISSICVPLRRYGQDDESETYARKLVFGGRSFRLAPPLETCYGAAKISVAERAQRGLLGPANRA